MSRKHRKNQQPATTSQRDFASPQPATSQGLSQQAQLCLHDMDTAFSQSHVRAQFVVGYLNTSVALLGGLIAVTASLKPDVIESKSYMFLLFPYPFLIFGSLILREDMLMASIHRYIYVQRYIIIKSAGLEFDDKTLGILSAQKQMKFGHLWRFFSLMRYLPSTLPAFGSLIYYLYISGSPDDLLQLIFIIVPALCLVGIAIGVVALGRMHGRIEKLRDDPAILNDR